MQNRVEPALQITYILPDRGLTSEAAVYTISFLGEKNTARSVRVGFCETEILTGS